MATIFPLSASVGQEFDGYIYDGTIWNLTGNEYNPTTFSSTAPENPKPGDLWVDSITNVPAVSLDDYLTLESASSTYATQSYVENELNNIDLTNTINTASAAAVSYLVDSAPAALDTLNELAAALGDDENFATTVTNSLSEKLDISSASTTYLEKSVASSTYLTSASMQTIPVYVMNSGSSAQRPVSASAGMFRFNTDSGYPEWYDAESNEWFNFYQEKVFILSYLIVAGGGGGGSDRGGGGGAGGLLASSYQLPSGTSSTTVTVGSGGIGGAASSAGGQGKQGNNGNSSSALSYTLTGGGGGGGCAPNPLRNGLSGGSGGGGSHYSGSGTGGAGISGQGFSGGPGLESGFGGGGGGAAAIGGSPNPNGGNGGSGFLSSISGNSTYYAGGGGGGTDSAGSGGTGGLGGGANGSKTGSGIDALPNLGGGGGGATIAGGYVGGNGGSGVVIFSYPSFQTIVVGAGLTSNTITVGSNKVTTFTSGTGTVTFNNG